MTFEKKKPVKSKRNLERIRRLDCFVCGARPPSDPDHILGRGAGGGDALTNLNALCRNHHVERHTIGLKRFVERYKSTLDMSREKYELPNMDLTFLYD